MKYKYLTRSSCCCCDSRSYCVRCTVSVRRIR